MSVRTLVQRTALVTVNGELRYTTSRLNAHEEGAPFAAEFESLCQKCVTLQNQEQAIQDTIVDAQAIVDHVDDLLDAFVKKLIRALDAITNNDRTHALVRFFFGNKTPSDFAKPTLGQQLGDMDSWVAALETNEHGTLRELAPELANLVAKGKAAAKGKTDADVARAHFRNVGDRYKFIEEVNAKRKKLYGDLSKLPHEKDTLPSHFADRFFRREPRVKDNDEPTTIEEIDDAIAELEKQIAALRENREALKQAAHKAVELQVKKHEEAIADLAKKKAALDAEQAAIQAQIDALKK